MSNQTNPVRVEYELDRDTWGNVVEESGEVMYVDEENSDTFIVEYANQSEFNAALERFQGMVKYKVVE